MNIYWEKIRELVASVDKETKAAIRSVSFIKSIRKVTIFSGRERSAG